MSVAEVTLHMCFCGTELAGLETWLSGRPGVRHAAGDRTRSLVDVEYDPAVTDPGRLRSLLDSHGYACECVDCPVSCCQPRHPERVNVRHVEDRVHLAHLHCPGCSADWRPLGRSLIRVTSRCHQNGLLSISRPQAAFSGDGLAAAGAGWRFGPSPTPPLALKRPDLVFIMT